MPVDTTRLKTRHAGSWITKVRETVSIPAFSYENTWRGASEVITRFIFPKSNNFSLLDIEAPTNPNYVLAVAWYEDEVMYRYKLWEGVGEIFWAPLYNGETITSDYFALEVWTTNDTPIEGAAMTFFTSRLHTPTNRCDLSAVDSGIIVYECGDPIFHFTIDAFNPSAGDYYIFQDYCTRIIVRGTITTPDNILYCADDDTWHYVWTDTFEGNVFIYVDQADSVPPPDALGYFVLINQQDQSNAYKIDIDLVEGNYNLQISDSPIVDAVEANVILIQNLQDGLYYSWILKTFEGGNTIAVGQTPT